MIISTGLEEATQPVLITKFEMQGATRKAASRGLDLQCRITYYVEVKSGNGKDLLQRIKQLVEARRYRIRIHVVRHMVEEGFNEANIVEVIVGRSKIIEDYPDESRCLILGYFHFTEKVESPLHVVCDYSATDVIDLVTAYIPQRPWWITPTKRGTIK